MNTTKKRRTFSKEFTQQAVELALQTGDQGQTARDLGIDRSNLRRWIVRFEGTPQHAFPGSGTPRDKEMAELKNQLHSLEQENAILKKAVGKVHRAPAEVPIHRSNEGAISHRSLMPGDGSIRQ